MNIKTALALGGWVVIGVITSTFVKESFLDLIFTVGFVFGLIWVLFINENKS